MLKSTFSGLQRRRWRYGYLAVVSSQICEIPRNSPKIRTYSSSRSPKVIDDGVKHTYTHSRSESWGRRRVRVDEREAVKTVPSRRGRGGCLPSTRTSHSLLCEVHAITSSFWIRYRTEVLGGSNLLCVSHQPQYGSLASRQSEQLLYVEQLCTRTRYTCNDKFPD